MEPRAPPKPATPAPLSNDVVPVESFRMPRLSAILKEPNLEIKLFLAVFQIDDLLDIYGSFIYLSGSKDKNKIKFNK